MAEESSKPENQSVRPVTFVFNGGPGASSAYLHMGAIGPKGMDFTEEGLPLPACLAVIFCNSFIF